MFKNPNRIPAFLFMVTLVLISNPELLTLILTVQAIGVETFILFLTLQFRSIGGGIMDGFYFVLLQLNAIAVKLSRLASIVLYLLSNPKNSCVIAQLSLLARLRIENSVQSLFPKQAYI